MCPPLFSMENEMNKIQRVSLFFRVLFQITFVVIPIALVIAWIKAPDPLFSFHGIDALMIPTKEYPVMHVLSLTTRLLGFMISLIPYGIELIILYFLIKLFGLYERGEIFSVSNVKYIRNIGYTLVIGQLLHPIYEGCMGVILTIGNPAGHRFASVTVDGTNIGVLLGALMVILISWIMAEGCKLREEQQLTI